jgi:hypothetical protein
MMHSYLWGLPDAIRKVCLGEPIFQPYTPEERRTAMLGWIEKGLLPPQAERLIDNPNAEIEQKVKEKPKNPQKNPKPVPPRKPGWGDRVSQALAKFGITDEKVSEMLGRPCNCPERREKLNRLGRWAESFFNSKEEAEQALEEIAKPKE